MKTCTKCFIEKDLLEFYVKDGKTGRMHAQCKSCYREHRKSYHAEHYQKYGNAYRARAKVQRAKIKRNLQNQMLSYLIDKRCEICGESDLRTLEFDHLDPSKKSFTIAKGLTDGKPWSVLLLEITKCRILCANCHKKHTSSQHNWYKQPR